jgi:hypothetical protein
MRFPCRRTCAGVAIYNRKRWKRDNETAASTSLSHISALP